MLYESDISNLLSQWQEVANRPSTDTSYKDGIRDCIYDLKMLIDKQFQEECLMGEVFEQQHKEDEKLWDDYLSGSYARERGMA